MRTSANVSGNVFLLAGLLFISQAEQAHDAITRNVTRVLQPHGGVVLQRFEFINVCMGEKRIRNLTYIRIFQLTASSAMSADLKQMTPAQRITWKRTASTNNPVRPVRISA